LVFASPELKVRWVHFLWHWFQ